MSVCLYHLAVLALVIPSVDSASSSSGPILVVMGLPEGTHPGGRTRHQLQLHVGYGGEHTFGAMVDMGNGTALAQEYEKIRELRSRLQQRRPPFLLLPRAGIEIVQIHEGPAAPAFVYDRFVRFSLRQYVGSPGFANWFGNILSISRSLAQALQQLHNIGFSLGGVSMGRVLVNNPNPHESGNSALLDDFSGLVDLSSVARVIDVKTFGSVLGQLVNGRSVPVHRMAQWKRSIARWLPTKFIYQDDDAAALSDFNSLIVRCSSSEQAEALNFDDIVSHLIRMEERWRDSCADMVPLTRLNINALDRVFVTRNRRN
jgi:hypothetical protein